MTPEAPTINEIVYQNIERIQAEQLKRMADVTGLTRFSRYHVNDLVQFDFNGLIRYGRITTVMNRAGFFPTTSTAAGHGTEKSTRVKLTAWPQSQELLQF